MCLVLWGVQKGGIYQGDRLIKWQNVREGEECQFFIVGNNCIVLWIALTL